MKRELDRILCQWCNWIFKSFPLVLPMMKFFTKFSIKKAISGFANFGGEPSEFLFNYKQKKKYSSEKFRKFSIFLFPRWEIGKIKHRFFAISFVPFKRFGCGLHHYSGPQSPIHHKSCWFFFMFLWFFHFFNFSLIQRKKEKNNFSRPSVKHHRVILLQIIDSCKMFTAVYQQNEFLTTPRCKWKSAICFDVLTARYS